MLAGTLERTFGLSGKKAIVTGGARGIGQAICEMFAGCGAEVVLADRDAENGEIVCKNIRKDGGKATFVKIDVADENSVVQAFKEADKALGVLDILVNNAAMIGMIPLNDIPVEYWDRMMAVNVKGPFLCAREAIKRMRGRDGRIINISSTASIIPGINGGAPYCASKAGVNGLTRSLALDHGVEGIRVNTVMPHSIRHKDAAAQLEEWNQPIPTGTSGDDSRYPLHRRGEPKDLAAMVTFLAGPGGAYITGQEFPVDGGFTIS